MEVTLRAERRTQQGSRASRRLRHTGMVPAVVYGADIDPQAVSVSERDLFGALHTEAGANAIISLAIEGGETYTTLAREIQRHPYRSRIDHLDFVKISLTEVVEAEVGIEFTGEAVGVRMNGGILDTIRNSVTIEALPTQIPSSIPVDVSELDIGDTLTLAALPVIEGVTYLDDPDTPIASVALPAAEVEVVEEEEEELEGVVEGEEPIEAAEEPTEEAADD